MARVGASVAARRHDHRALGRPISPTPNAPITAAVSSTYGRDTSRRRQLELQPAAQQRARRASAPSGTGCGRRHAEPRDRPRRAGPSRSPGAGLALGADADAERAPARRAAASSGDAAGPAARRPSPARSPSAATAVMKREVVPARRASSCIGSAASTPPDARDDGRPPSTDTSTPSRPQAADHGHGVVARRDAEQLAVTIGQRGADECPVGDALRSGHPDDGIQRPGRRRQHGHEEGARSIWARCVSKWDAPRAGPRSETLRAQMYGATGSGIESAQPVTAGR